MKGVAELVEHRADLVQGQQGGFARCRLGDVLMVADDRLASEQEGLADVSVHPSAPAFGGPGVQVRQEKGERLAVGVADLEDADIRVVRGQVVPFLEGQSVEPARGVEDAVAQDAVQLEVRTQPRFVEGVARLPDLLRVEAPVARGELETAAFLIDHRLEVRCLSPGVGGRAGGEVGQQGVHRVDAAGGLVFQLVGRVAGVAEQCRAFGACLGDSQDTLPRVELAARGVATQGDLHDPLAQGAVP